MIKPLFGGSAAIAAMLLASSFIFSAKPSIAETLFSQFPPQKQETSQAVKPEVKGPAAASQTQRSEQPSAVLSGAVIEATDPAGAVSAGGDLTAPYPPPANYVATAYSLGGRTASGRRPTKGLIAADPSVLPLGSRVRLDAGAYSGDYLVADTGGGVHGKRIDIWTPNSREATRFGRRKVKLTVLSYGKRNLLHRRPRH